MQRYGNINFTSNNFHASYIEQTTCDTVPFNKLAFECFEPNSILTSSSAYYESLLLLISFTRIVLDQTDMNTDGIENGNNLYSLDAENNSNLKR